MDVFNRIESMGIIPNIKLKQADDAVAICSALSAGGLPVAEITYQTEAAEECIRRVAKELPHVLLGAGTVLSARQAESAVAAGAQFIVTQGFNPNVVDWCVDNNITVIPGCSTSSDIEYALDFGLRILKLLHSESQGTIDAIKTISEQYPDVYFIPAGGIHEGNLSLYLSTPKVIACCGTWMVREDLIDAKQFDTITNLTRSTVNSMLGFEIAHVGINARGAEEAQKIAERFCFLFGWTFKMGNSSVFSGTGVEVVKQNGRGTKGHIAVYTNSIIPARAYMERRGILFDEGSLVLKDGKAVAIYLEEEINGFAIHLLQR